MSETWRREVVVQIAGGLGNQLFQYAMGRRLALRTDARLVLDHLSGFPRDFYKRSFALDNFNITCDYIPASASYASTLGRIRRRVHRWLNRNRPLEHRWYFEENGPSYDPRLTTLHPQTQRTYFEGYWQHEEYFRDIRELLLEDLSLKAEREPANAEVARRIDTVEAICLHVRRLHGVPNVQHAVPLPDRPDLIVAESYYDRAVAHLVTRVQNPHFFVFADFPDWAKEHIRLPYPAEYVTHNGAAKDYLDFWLMTRCRHFVIANSTFSWWAAWLARNPSKIVVAPKSGIGAELKSVPPEWVMV